jgi:carboxyl-terminal processing protease
MRLLRLLLPALLLACTERSPETAGPATATPAVVHSFEGFAPIAGEVPPALHGWWRSDGYGFVIHLEPDEVSQYLETASICYREAHTKDDVLELFHLYEMAADGDLRLASYERGTVYIFRPIAAPPPCLEQADATPEATFDAFWHYFDEHYAFFDERRIDWRERRARLEPVSWDAVTENDLLELLAAMLEGFDDAHTEVLEAMVNGEERDVPAALGATRERLHDLFERQGEVATFRELDVAWLQTHRAAIAEMLGEEARRTARGQIDWGSLGEELGYVHFLTFGRMAAADGVEESERALHEALDEALSALGDKRALIVDVSQNRGGYDRLALAAAGHFADAPRLAYTKRARGANGPPQAFRVHPEGAFQFTGPIYVLTSDVTVSAGEVFVLAMSALPHVVLAGRPTRGCFSDELPRSLPNGWWFGLSNEVYRDAAGGIHEVRGLEPALPLEVFDPSDLFGSGHRRAVASLAAIVREKREGMPGAPQ